MDTLYSGAWQLPWWGMVIYTLVVTHITIASVTIFLHRNQTHRALDLRKSVSHFFRFCLWLTTGMVTKEWVAVHRKHHARCETTEDPHSPQVLGLNRVLWGGVFLYVKASRDKKMVERYGAMTPDDLLERDLYSRPLGQKLGVTLMFVLDMWLFGILPGFVVWAVQMVWIPFWAAGVINGVGHYFGYRNFPRTEHNASTNMVKWGIIIGGEEFHNNHHQYPISARFSIMDDEFDLGWQYIRFMELLRLAKVKESRLAPLLSRADYPATPS